MGAGMFVGFAVLATFGVVIGVGAARFRASFRSNVRNLFSDSDLTVGREQLQARWKALPEPVRRYFHYAIHEQALAIRAARPDYREFNGFRVPTSVEASWELETGLFTYARFRITTLEYNIRKQFFWPITKPNGSRRDGSLRF